MTTLTENDLRPALLATSRYPGQVPYPSATGKVALVLEQPPHYRTIAGTGRIRDGHYYRLPLPWMVYVVGFTSLESWARVKGKDYQDLVRVIGIYGRSMPVTVEDDMLYFVPLPSLRTYSVDIGRSGVWGCGVRTLGLCSYASNMHDLKGFKTSDDLSDPKMQEAAWRAIEQFWETQFGYFSFKNIQHGQIAPDTKQALVNAYYWVLARPRDTYTPAAVPLDNAELLSRWESLSLDEVLAFPWGRVEMFSLRDYLEHLPKNWENYSFH